MTTLQTALTVATAATASGTLAAGKHTPVDATSGALTMTLPTPATIGARLRVEKVDASTNAVSVSGTIRGVTSTINLAWQYESVELFAESLTSWRVAAGHKTKAALDAAYVATVPAPTGTAATDTAAIQAAIDAANSSGGGAVLLRAGTYTVTGLVMKSNVWLTGQGRAATIVKLANGANADVIQGANFTTLTLGGTTGGIFGWQVSDLTIDGNGANQTGGSYGLREYGADWDIHRVSIRNCRSYGLYTEWANSASGTGLPDASMEARISDCRIHDNNVATGAGGWLNRGPHDLQASNIIVSNNNGGRGLWAQSPQPTTVTAGSNGVDLSTFTSGAPGTLNVTTTVGWPSVSLSATQGSLIVPTAQGNVTVTFTSTDGNHFFGCVAQGSPAVGSTVSTGAAVTTQGYAASGSAYTQVHIWGNHSIAWTLDTWSACTGCAAEGANTGQVLIRSNESSWYGGNVFYLVAGPGGYGIQLGDSTVSAGGVVVYTQMDNFTGATAASAAVNAANSGGGNRIVASVYQSTGTPVFGTFSSTDHVDVRVSGLGSQQANAQGSVVGLAPAVTGLLNGSTQAGAGAVVAGSVLGWTQYAPATRSVKAVSAVALGAFDATNLTATFTAPSSGQVRVKFRAVMSCASTSVTANLGFWNHTGNAVVGTLDAFSFASTGAQTISHEQIVTGLTPGQSYQWDLIGAVSTAATALNVICFSNATAGGSSGGAAVISIEAL